MIAVGDGGGVGPEDPTTQSRGHGHRPAEGPRAGALDLIFWSAVLVLFCYFLSAYFCSLSLLLSMNLIFCVVGVLESLHKSEGREGTIGEEVFHFFETYCLEKGPTLFVHLFVYLIVLSYWLLCSMTTMNEFCSVFILFSTCDQRIFYEFKIFFLKFHRFENSKYFL